MKNEFKTDNSNSDLKSFLDRPMTRESWLGKSLLCLIFLKTMVILLFYLKIA